MATVLGLILVCATACNKGDGDGEEGAEGAEGTEGTEGTEGEGTTETPEPAAAAMEWMTLGELPVQANVPAGTTVTQIGSMTSARTPDGCQFRVVPPPAQAFMAGPQTLEDSVATAANGTLGTLVETLMSEPSETDWMHGYIRENAMSPGQNRWVLDSLRTLGDVKYDCISTNDDLAGYECAIEMCRTLRAAQ
jgi:hypothetical protein